MVLRIFNDWSLIIRHLLFYKVLKRDVPENFQLYTEVHITTIILIADFFFQ